MVSKNARLLLRQMVGLHLASAIIQFIRRIILYTGQNGTHSYIKLQSLTCQHRMIRPSQLLNGALINIILRSTNPLNTRDMVSI